MLSGAGNLQLHLWDSVTYSAASRLLELSVCCMWCQSQYTQHWCLSCVLQRLGACYSDVEKGIVAGREKSL